MKTSLFFLLAFLLFVGCTNEKKETKQLPATTPGVATPKGNPLSERDAIMAIGREVLVQLKAKNYNELVKYFSAEGVLFAPYGYVDTTSSKKLTGADFLTAIDKKWILTWGSYDGTGDPIKLTVPKYLSKFVYNANYLAAEATGYDEIIKQGNAMNNLKTVFPNKHFIDYHFSGFNQKNEGMDWTSLKLVIAKEDGQYFLVAIIHDQWTI